MEKRKNESNHTQRNLLIGIMVFWVLVLIGLLGGYIYVLLPSGDSFLEPTHRAIEATNYFIGTAIAETQAVSTSQPSRSEALTAAGGPYPTDATAQMYASIADTAQAQMMATLTEETIITETQVP